MLLGEQFFSELLFGSFPVDPEALAKSRFMLGDIFLDDLVIYQCPLSNSLINLNEFRLLALLRYNIRLLHLMILPFHSHFCLIYKLWNIDVLLSQVDMVLINDLLLFFAFFHDRAAKCTLRSMLIFSVDFKRWLTSLVDWNNFFCFRRWWRVYLAMLKRLWLLAKHFACELANFSGLGLWAYVYSLEIAKG